MALVLALSAVAAGCSGSSPAGGPELTGGFDGLGWLDSMDAGATFTGGQIVLENTTGETVRVVDVRPQLASGAELEFLGAHLAGEDRPWATTDRRLGSPPDEGQWGRVVPAVGASLPPLGPEDRGLELLLGFTVTGDGRSHMDAVHVDYEVAGERKTLTIASTITVCAPSTSPCDPE